ncbi:MAG: ATP-dependent helicase HrpB [Porticoccaceae bacterium]|nr:MAG: ATP-dependent helicase HrpB [Porticoccaceae bacterium]
MSAPLPIDAALPELLAALGAHPRCLLVAEPGAGKTSRVPPALLAALGGRWLLLEPRRAAARLAAGWLAASFGEPVGATVGLRIREETRVSPATRLEVLTQGVFLRLIQEDPSLEGVAGVIFDEFHERALEADLGLAFALDAQRALCPELRLLIMSATLDVAALKAFLGPDTPVVRCPGRTFPVRTHYLPPSPRDDPVAHQADAVQRALAEGEGDVLVFLPGRAEIAALSRALARRGVAAQPLHGGLSLAAQQAVLTGHRPDRRRVVLATSVAESSVTVPGVRAVVDAGFERTTAHDPRTGLPRLVTRRVNRASADQRRGRAGREAPGWCLRLWSPEQPLAPHRLPEILEADLAGLCLEVLRWGSRHPDELPWLTPPPPAAWEAGMRLLGELGLIDRRGRLTPLGERAARHPTHPRLAVLLERAAALGQLALGLRLVALFEEAIPVPEADLEVLVTAPLPPGPAGARWRRAIRRWRARLGGPEQEVEPRRTGELLAAAFPDRIAQRGAEGRFRLAAGGGVRLPAHHPLARSEFLVVAEAEGRADGAVRAAAAVDRETLEALFAERLERRVEVRWDEGAGRVQAEEVCRLGALTLARRPSSPSPAAGRALLLDALRRRGALPWSDRDRQLLGRIELLARLFGEPWSAWCEARLLAELEGWLGPHLEGKLSLAEVAALPLGEILLAQLPWAQREALDRLAPTHLQLPGGRRVALDYRGPEPVLSAPVQALFGLAETPAVAGGRAPVVLELLSPAGRPVQVTRDLGGFWRGSYREVRRELRGRYPKHAWPEDPLAAAPAAPLGRGRKRRGKGV